MTISITNTGDIVTIILEKHEIKVSYDGTKLRNLTGNDRHRFVGQIIANAIEQYKEATKVPPIWWAKPGAIGFTGDTNASTQQSPVQEARGGTSGDAQAVAERVAGQVQQAAGAGQEKEEVTEYVPSGLSIGEDDVTEE